MTTVGELIEQLRKCDANAHVVVATREEYLGSVRGFGIETTIAGEHELSLTPGMVVLRESFDP